MRVHLMLDVFIKQKTVKFIKCFQLEKIINLNNIPEKDLKNRRSEIFYNNITFNFGNDDHPGAERYNGSIDEVERWYKGYYYVPANHFKTVMGMLRCEGWKPRIDFNDYIEYVNKRAIKIKEIKK